jgi:hypothetical protein
MSTISPPSAEAPVEDAKTDGKKLFNEGESAQATAEGADDVSPPTEGSAKG